MRLTSSTASQGESECIAVSGCDTASQYVYVQPTCRNKPRALNTTLLLSSFLPHVTFIVLSPRSLCSTHPQSCCYLSILSHLSAKMSPRMSDKRYKNTVPDYPPNNRVSAKEAVRTINTASGDKHTHNPTHHSTSSELPGSHPSYTCVISSIASTFSLGTLLWGSRNQTLTATQQLFNPTVHQHTHTSIVKALNRPPAHVRGSFPIVDSAAHVKINWWRNVGTEFKEKPEKGGGKS